jgi:hypothetical protein
MRKYAIDNAIVGMNQLSRKLTYSVEEKNCRSEECNGKKRNKTLHAIIYSGDFNRNRRKLFTFICDGRIPNDLRLGNIK